MLNLKYKNKLSYFKKVNRPALSTVLVILNFYVLIFVIVFNLSVTTVNAKIFTEDKSTEINKNITSSASIAGVSVDKTANVEFMAAQIVQVVLSIIGVIFIIFIILAGQQWMTAAGNDEKIKKAKDKIIALSLGLLVILLAYVASIWIFQWFHNFQQNFK